MATRESFGIVTNPSLTDVYATLFDPTQPSGQKDKRIRLDQYQLAVMTLARLQELLQIEDPLTVTIANGKLQIGLDLALSGLNYTFSTGTTTDPTAGLIELSAAWGTIAVNDIITLYIHKTDRDSTSRGAALLATLPGATVRITDEADTANYLIATVNTITDDGTDVELSADVTEIGSVIADTADVALLITNPTSASVEVLENGTSEGSAISLDFEGATVSVVNGVATITITATGGETGEDGQNAYTTTTANFTVPAVNANRTIDVASSDFAIATQVLFVEGAGYYRVITKPSATQLEVENLGYTGNAAPSAVITSGAGVSPAGERGDAGPSGLLTSNSGVVSDHQATPPTTGSGQSAIYPDTTGLWRNRRESDGVDLPLGAAIAIANLTELANIGPTQRIDGLVLPVSVGPNGNPAHYVLRGSSADTADGSNIVAPTAGAGRWHIFPSGSASTPTSGVTALWQLEDLSDSVGNLNLTNEGGVTFGTATQGNGAVFTSNTDEVLRVATDPVVEFGDDQFAIFAIATPQGSSTRTIFDKNNAVRVFISNSGPWSFRFGDGTNVETFQDVTNVTNGTTYFILVTYDRTVGTFGESRVYINDSLVLTNTHTISIGVGSSTDDLFIGKRFALPALGYEGIIDQAGILNYIPSAAQRSAWYNAGGGVADPTTIFTG